MNKKKDPNEVRNIHHLVRLNKIEQTLFAQKLREANGMKSTDFIRKMICYGYVQAPIKKSDLIESRQLLRLLIEYRTNFHRISNFIKYKDPQLNREVEFTARSIQKIIDLI